TLHSREAWDGKSADRDDGNGGSRGRTAAGLIIVRSLSFSVRRAVAARVAPPQAVPPPRLKTGPGRNRNRGPPTDQGTVRGPRPRSARYTRHSGLVLLRAWSALPGRSAFRGGTSQPFGTASGCLSRAPDGRGGLLQEPG